MAGSGTTALATDVSNPYGTGVNVMGVGSVTRGYGQTTFGATKNVGDTITANDFNNIRYDLLNASAHQNGSAAALTLAGNITGAQINSTDPNSFASYASTVDSDRFNCHSSRKTTGAAGSNSRSSSWASSVSALYTLNFSSADQARYFWNGGGKIRFASSRTGGAASAQNTAWSSLLSSAGTQEFGGSAVYGWSTGDSSLYSIFSSAPYASNTYNIKARTNVNNSAGAASIFYFTLTWNDPYVDPMPGAPPLPEDIVDGTLDYSVEITYPTGGHALTPSGTWTSYSYASYSAGAITGG
jgi:hypothetical protein